MWHPEGGSGPRCPHVGSWRLKLRELIIQIMTGKITGKETRHRPEPQEYPSLPSLRGHRAGVERDELSENQATKASRLRREGLAKGTTERLRPGNSGDTENVATNGASEWVTNQQPWEQKPDCTA